MKKSVHKVVEWLKRISWQAWISIFFSILGTYFAYDSYYRNNCGEIEPVINEKPCKSNLTIALFHTDDTIQVYYPQLSQCIKNTSKYSIKNLKINSRISCLPYDKKILDSFDFEVNPAFKHTSINISNEHQTIDFTYKQSDFYAGESSPAFLKKIRILPKYKNDTTFHYIDIITTVNWDGAEEKKFYSRINISCVPSTANFKTWVEKVIKFSKGKLIDDGIDVILCYKSYSDSLNNEGFPQYSRGSYTHFKDLNNSLIDSISLNHNSSYEFYRKHYGYLHEKELPPDISYIGILIASICILISLIPAIVFIREFRKSKISEKASTSLLFIYLFSSGIYLLLGELSKLYQSMSCFNTIKTICVVPIVLIQILFITYFFVIGIKNIKHLKKIYFDDKWSVWAWFVANIFWIGSTWFFIDEFINLVFS